MNYTKGEWILDFTEEHNGVVSVYVPKKGTVAKILTRSNDDYIANAYLIAVAPELYEKLSKVRTWLIRLAEHAESGAKTERFLTLKDALIADAKNYRATIADIDIALAKAEGKGG